MTTMLQRIRERAAFDQAKVSLNAIEQMKMGVAIDSAYIRGAREENGYLLPLIDALIQALEVSEKALETIEEQADMHDNPFAVQIASPARASMQSILEKAVK